MAKANIAKIQAFEGLIVAPFTPLKPNGELNIELIPTYVDRLVSQGVKGAFVNGTTGESLSLTVEERKAAAEVWAKAAKNRLFIILHIGANCLKDAKELAAHAEKIGVDAISSLPPIFYKPQNHEQLIAYFKQIADAAPTLPFVLYHNPGYAGVEITLAEFLPKARKVIPTFCGAKYTSTEIRDLLNCHYLPGEPFKLMPGVEEVLLPFLTCGVTAAVGALYTFQAPLSVKIIELFKKGDIEGARKIQNKVMEAALTIGKYGQGIACLKAAANIIGPLDFGPPRQPLSPLTPENHALLKEALKPLITHDWTRS